jgi:hypothetical protein
MAGEPVIVLDHAHQGKGQDGRCLSANTVKKPPFRAVFEVKCGL